MHCPLYTHAIHAPRRLSLLIHLLQNGDGDSGDDGDDDDDDDDAGRDDSDGADNDNYEYTTIVFNIDMLPHFFSRHHHHHHHTHPNTDSGPVEPCEFDLEVFKCHNQARTDPQSLIPHLEKRLKKFKGKTIIGGYGDGDGINIATEEGPAAVQELIDFLRNQEPLPALEWQAELMLACRDHVLDTGGAGTTGHTGIPCPSPSPSPSPSPTPSLPYV